MEIISNLPFEILEAILLFAIYPVPSPTRNNTYTGIFVLRWEQDVQSGGSVLAKLLSPRLVSSRFRAASWKPFGIVLGETLFDLRSQDSLGNLMALSSCEMLTPWVKKLTVGFYSAPRGFRFSHMKEDILRDLGSASVEELRRIHNVETSWWPCVLRFKGHNSQDSEMAPSYSDTEWILNTVATCFKALKNLDDICYSFDTRILPARYKPVLQHLPQASAFQLTPDTSSRIQRRAQQGLDLLFQALNISNTAPSRLDISTPPDGKALATATHAGVLQRSCHCVTNLTIRYSELVSRGPCQILQHCGVNLDTITLFISNETPHSILPDESLRTHIPYMMEAIRPLNVSLLRIQLGTDASWARTDYKRWHQSDLLELGGSSEQWMAGVAETVQVQPKGLSAYLKRYGGWDGVCCEWDGE